MRNMVNKCPICDGHEFKITGLKCDSCGTQVQGSFTISRLGSLSKEHQDFVDIFLKCRGSIKDVERELGISYPTVRRRLDGVIRALGYQTEDGAMRRRDILKALDEKKMSPEEAVEALKGLS